MHKFLKAFETIPAPRDPWAPELSELLVLAQFFLPDGETALIRPVGRPGFIINRYPDGRICRWKYGADAQHIEDELRLLRSQINEVQGMYNKRWWIPAAAFFHLRYVNIHPLRDGNGRTARALSLIQCSKELGISFESVRTAFNNIEPEYFDIFMRCPPAMQVGALSNLLCRLFKVTPFVSLDHFPISMRVIYREKTPAPSIEEMNSRFPPRKFTEAMA